MSATEELAPESKREKTSSESPEKWLKSLIVSVNKLHLPTGTFGIFLAFSGPFILTFG